jgi:hypothetical protein
MLERKTVLLYSILCWFFRLPKLSKSRVRRKFQTLALAIKQTR